MEASPPPLDVTRPSLHPDPEANGLASPAWPASGLPCGPDSSTAAPFQSHARGTFFLQNSRAEFELASARRRSQSRELSDQSDFLEELSENE